MGLYPFKPAPDIQDGSTCIHGRLSILLKGGIPFREDAPGLIVSRCIRTYGRNAHRDIVANPKRIESYPSCPQTNFCAGDGLGLSGSAARRTGRPWGR
jgi:hypothetical protein